MLALIYEERGSAVQTAAHAAEKVTFDLGSIFLCADRYVQCMLKQGENP